MEQTETKDRPPTSCRRLPGMGIHVVVDAVNAMPNEAARRMMIGALKKREPAIRWIRLPNGYLDVAEAIVR